MLSATIPADVPYLTAEPEVGTTVAHALEGGAGLPGRSGMGYSNPSHKNDRNRSCTLATLAPLAHLPLLALFSLQTGPAARQIDQPPPGMVLPSPDLSLDGAAAAVIARLDLVITVDTASGPSGWGHGQTCLDPAALAPIGVGGSIVHTRRGIPPCGYFASQPQVPGKPNARAL